MKKRTKKYTPEEMLHFVYSFASAFSIGAVPGFEVEATSTKNRYFFRIKTVDNTKCIVYPSYMYADTTEMGMGTIGGIEKLFKAKHPRIMLRRQFITFDELVNDFGLDKHALAEVVFKFFKRQFDIFKKMSSWLHVTAMQFKIQIESHDWEFPEIVKEDDLKSTTFVSTIDELMVWADLNQGA